MLGRAYHPPAPHRTLCVRLRQRRNPNAAATTWKGLWVRKLVLREIT